MYAILDIESTGGKYNEEGITEIAIYKFDGNEIVDQFSSLINPERKIQSFVVGLTGINNEMLHQAPKFYEIAKRIIEITEGCIVVAHNAKFDYRMLRLEFDRLGYPFERKTLCTVKLSKKLLPDFESYSLGKLVRKLGIPITDRHRASGDALATVKLFKLLLEKDTDKEIISSHLKLNAVSSIDTKLIRLIDDLPNAVGVYYFSNKEGDIIYVGKSNDIKKRANQHFISDAPKSREIQEHISSVDYEKTGNELMALLKENQSIKKLKPKYNSALKKDLFTHGLYMFEDHKGYFNLTVSKLDSKKEYITSFTNYQQGKAFLERALETYQLCQKLTGLHKTKGACFNYTIKKCDGACIQEEDAVSYNSRVIALIEFYNYKDKNMIIQDRGRHLGEKSVVLIEHGKLIGFGYTELNFQIENISILKNIINPMQNDRDAQHIIQSYLRKNNKNLKVIHF
ncbi:exonuclease [Psychroflexus gondwanensis]|uniref:DNA polymerase III epsilon subunit related exonuclease DnaQ/UvrC-like protein n=1 Tax=Psychroflexus gondwanensis ACAM 44 TaxID=1189619 RepID=N1WNG6_9FLAO|nr:exonuclease domain-containing protein [Psychroflexus gondwanensis]EMY81836.1 DNA polymerase III epsilon subunit related exonuclease DnaQ/UvrC-like protein [Psychroflexus gondwanensis ACAM 44]TXE19852.1 exonuclease [Psychroflexus gondwanensis]